MVNKIAERVSNPWREAIEGGWDCGSKVASKVSNPWREAIEAIKFIKASLA